MNPAVDTALKLPPREAKPRRRGLTTVIDFGPDGFGWTGVRGVADLLDCAADYIDFAKIYALNALLIPEQTVNRIVKLYRDAGVLPFAGGILFEYAHERGQLDDLARHLRRLELPGLEISENYLGLSDAERLRAIERFQRQGFKVIYEFGRKNPTEPISLEHLGELVTTMTDLGVEHVIVEQSEIDLTARDLPEVIDALPRQPWFDRIMIEADPYRFPGQHVELIRTFGPEVNLANIAAGQALRLEGLRRGIGRAVNYSLFAEGG